MADERRETPPAPGICLKVTDPDGRVRDPVPVRRGIAVGRSPDNDLVLDDPRVSKYHARVFVSMGGGFVEDLGSRNGTRLNGVPIGANAEIAINVGDVLEFGAYEAVVVRCAPGGDSPLGAGEDGAEETRLVALADLAASLSDEQRGLLAAIVETADEEARVRAFCRRYLEDPLGTVRLENAAVRARLGAAEKMSPQDVPGATLQALLSLNARVERLLFPEATRREEIGPETYEVLEDVEFLVHGDLLPSHLSDLSDPRTHDHRELLVAHKVHTDLQDLLKEARAVGICRLPDVVHGEAREAAAEVFDVCMSLYSADPEPRLHAGEMKTLGYFSRRGGSCRHRSATLQLMFQEAGIRSRYVRGVLLGSGPHAWVEVNPDGGEGFDLVADPNFGVMGRKGETRSLGKVGGRSFACFGLAEGRATGAHRPQDLVYGRPEGAFNTVWRPKRRHGLAS